MMFKSIFTGFVLIAAAASATEALAMKGTDEIAAPAGAESSLSGIIDRIDLGRGMLYINGVEYLFSPLQANFSSTVQKGMTVIFKTIPDGGRRRITELTVQQK
jgi:hypothetical protein